MVLLPDKSSYQSNSDNIMQIKPYNNLTQIIYVMQFLQAEKNSYQSASYNAMQLLPDQTSYQSNSQLCNAVLTRSNQLSI